MGVLVNLEKDDVYFVWDIYMDQGYFVSDWELCLINYCYDIYWVQNVLIKIILEGYIYNVEIEEIFLNVNMIFKDI